MLESPRAALPYFTDLVLNSGMRHPSLRGTAFTCAFAFVLLLSAACGAALVLLLFFAPSRDALAGLPLHQFPFTHPVPSDGSSLACFWVLGAVTVVVLAVSLFLLRARGMYTRFQPPALLYFIVYLFSLCMESLRGLSAWLYAWKAALPLIMPISRVLYGCRFVGQLALLLTALAMLDMKYRKRFVVLGILFLTAFAVAVYIPMDNTVFLSTLMYKLGDGQGAGFVDCALGILTAAGMAAAGYVKKQPRFLIMAGASALLFLGRQIISYTVPTVILAAGPVFLILGIAVFLDGINRVYGEPSAQTS